MNFTRHAQRIALVFCMALMLASGAGCTAFLAPRSAYPITPPSPPLTGQVAGEKRMISMPRYTIEPPDILLVAAVKVVPKPPHRIEPFDGLIIRVLGALPDQPIADAFAVDLEGKVDLGPSYGRVSVGGMTTDEARNAIRNHLSQRLGDIEVSISLAFSAGAQPISGEHLVGPDGRVNLGTYGSVFVAGKTIEDAKQAIEEQLSNYLDKPEVIVDVLAYNSKKYYIITQGGGLGDNITPAPVTGNETVLDAIGVIGGISQVSSTRIWIARPSPTGDCEQILPVDWAAISRGGSPMTNYQLMPGDRVYIAEDPFVRFDAIVAKYTRPFERLFGFVSLGTAMGNRIKRYGLGTF